MALTSLGTRALDKTKATVQTHQRTQQRGQPQFLCGLKVP
jgi:hypothetical protein